MKNFWDNLFGLNSKHSIWVEEEELGQEKVIYHKRKRLIVKIPREINKKIILRLRGYGKKWFRKTGDLYLHLWLNKGDDVRKDLWLSETSARNGADKRLYTGEKTITMVVPPRSNNGLTIRLRGFGRGPGFSPYAPALRQGKKGNLLVRLFIYPDNVVPKYGSFENLSTENMALGGWVYQKYGEIINVLNKTHLPQKAIRAETITDIFNEWGWMKILHVFVDHLGLADLDISLVSSVAISTPGVCKKIPVIKDNKLVGYKYEVTIKKDFLNNPFLTAAILVHELCHVIYWEKIDKTPKTTGYVLMSDQETLEIERTVDLLVFMFKVGEFQLRVARDKHITLGYFNQEIFERMQVIVSRKSFHS